MIHVRVITPPAELAVPLADVKAHLRVEISDDDALITRLIQACTRAVERRAGRALVTQTLEASFDAFPAGALCLPRPPLQSVTSVVYDDTDHAEQTFAAAKYAVLTTTEPGRLILVPNESWPAVRDGGGAVRVRFVAGHGAASDVPETFVAAITLWVGLRYERRLPPDDAAAIPPEVEALINLEDTGEYP